MFGGIGKLLGGVASAALPVVGSVVEGVFAKKEASKNRNFQAEQSSTQYQRAVDDLRAAGLNPVIAAGGPSQAMSGSVAQTPNFSQAGSSAVQNQLIREQLKSIQAQAAKDNTQAELNKVAAGLTAAQIQQTGASIRQMDASTTKLLAEAGLTQQQIDSFAGVLRGGGTVSEAARAIGFTGKKLYDFINTLKSGDK